MARCSGTKANGDPCRLAALAQQDVCWAHAPENAAKRKRAATKGGKSKGPNRELADIKRLISALVAGVLKGTTNRGDAAVCGQLANTQLRAVAVELKVREQLDLVERMEELEEIIERQNKRGA